MALCSQYRVLPCQISCDTLFLCYNPYFDVRLQQCHSMDDLVVLLARAPPTHRVVLLAESFDAGADLLHQLSVLQRRLPEKEAEEEEALGRIEEGERVNEQLSSLAQRLAQPPQHGSSFLHLQCLLNSTQQKINSLSSQIKARERQQRSRTDKRTQKQQKVQEKQLQQLQRTKDALQQKRQGIQQQISIQQDLLWWKQECRNTPPLQHYYQEHGDVSSCEDLLSFSEQKKENILP